MLWVRRTNAEMWPRWLVFLQSCSEIKKLTVIIIKIMGYRQGARYVRGLWSGAGPFFFLLVVATLFFGCAPVQRPLRETEDTFLRARALQTRTQGASAYEGGDYRAALVRFREALDMDTTLGDGSGRVADLVGMGRAQTALGKVPRALKTLTSAVKLAFSTRDERGLSEAYSALAEAFLRSGRLEMAVKNIKDALLLEDAGAGQEPRTLNLAGRVYLEAGRVDEAAGVVDKAIAIEGKGRPGAEAAESYRLMARILARKDEATMATAYYRKAYGIDESMGNLRAMALDLRGSAGLLAGAGWYEEAAGLYKKAYLLDRKAGLVGREIEDLDKLVDLYHSMGDRKNERFYRAMREAVLSDAR